MNAPLPITHEEAVRHFVADVEGHRCVLEYDLAGTVMTITHTGVPEPVGGRGIAAALTREAFETARSRGWRIVPACSYARVFMQRHPEYADLLA
ncbi:MAG TPA: GNAT family N-acetyltransferase [Dokdonella sp.]|uniref:GNAT family N-acetyltransferase n=1 Tax=Dokdonella sp. TaxID=2291710 RepID=UPI002C20DFDE|nr:GNAT family N-acetyltransferase [Dokdonella sp.]HUD41557.1 GNAT family N-acetyltransferase [Dokdonella sp.]